MSDQARHYECTDPSDLHAALEKGSLNLTKLGFKVKELVGGLECWKRDGYDTESGK